MSKAVKELIDYFESIGEFKGFGGKALAYAGGAIMLFIALLLSVLPFVVFILCFVFGIAVCIVTSILCLVVWPFDEVLKLFKQNE